MKRLTAALGLLLVGGALGAAIAGSQLDGKKLTVRQDFTIVDGDKLTATLDRTTSGDIAIDVKVYHSTWTQTLQTATFSPGTTDLSGYLVSHSRFE